MREEAARLRRRPRRLRSGRKYASATATRCRHRGPAGRPARPSDGRAARQARASSSRNVASITSASAPATNGDQRIGLLACRRRSRAGSRSLARPRPPPARSALPSSSTTGSPAARRARSGPGGMPSAARRSGRRWRPRGRLEQIAEALRLVVADREAGHAIIAPGEHRTRFEQSRSSRRPANRGLAAGPDAAQISRDKADRLAAAVDRRDRRAGRTGRRSTSRPPSPST